VEADKAIKGFGGATLLSAQPEKTAALLENVMGLERVGEENGYIRFRSTADLGNVIDVKTTVEAPGTMGTGTVHHIAWRASDYGNHEQWKAHVAKSGYGVTDVIDRQYFNAIYFREEGNILFEIATDPPGFTRDESFEEMGKGLLLPPWLEPHRKQIEDNLLPAEARVLKEDE
jgi:glyoxalase family protein